MSDKASDKNICEKLRKIILCFVPCFPGIPGDNDTGQSRGRSQLHCNIHTSGHNQLRMFQLDTGWRKLIPENISSLKCHWTTSSQLTQINLTIKSVDKRVSWHFFQLWAYFVQLNTLPPIQVHRYRIHPLGYKLRCSDTGIDQCSEIRADQEDRARHS